MRAHFKRTDDDDTKVVFDTTTIQRAKKNPIYQRCEIFILICIKITSSAVREKEFALVNER